MNFKGHFYGALFVGASLSTCLHFLGSPELPIEKLPRNIVEFFDADETLELSTIFSITVFMALFPDLDTDSHTQRWFYRGLLVLSLFLLLSNELLILSALAIVSFIPLIDKHRGLSHHPLIPIGIGLLLPTAIEVSQEREFEVNMLLLLTWDTFREYGKIMLAVVLGHYTHLILDSTWVRLRFRKPKKRRFF